MEWTNWFPIHNLKFEDIPKEPGIYQVRWAINGEPQPINRLDRTDNSGLLYIGVSTNLQSRIKNFWKRLKGGKAPHTAGHTFTAYNFERKIKPKHLEVRWAQLQKRELDSTETIFLESARERIIKPIPTLARQSYQLL